MIAYVSIGNSDDRLTQAEWAEYCRLANELLSPESNLILRRHGVWFSPPHAAFQNACWCVEIDRPTAVEAVKVGLRAMAQRFRQDSIAWAVAETEFLRGESK